MKKTVLAMTTALLLAGGAASTASAQTTTYYYENGHPTYYDSDRDGVPNRYDRYDNRYDRYRPGTPRVVVNDRDCDGVPDRYDPNVFRDSRDADCDGIPNRYDDYYNPTRTTYRSSHYVMPYGYHGRRYAVGSYLPSGYYGDSYYIDYEPYGLTPPPYGYRWNRVGNDVYLVSVDTGLISEVLYDLFH